MSKYLGAYQRLHAGEESFLTGDVARRSTELFTGSNFVKKLYSKFRSHILDAGMTGVRVLDYGCGKANYLREPLKSFGLTAEDTPRPDLPLLSNFASGTIQTISLYDPGFLPLSSKPADFMKTFYDIVICADVMEHVPQEDVMDTLYDLCDAAHGGILLMSISCKPAVKKFCNGINLHVTIKDPDWWKEAILKAIPGEAYVVFETADGGSETWHYKPN